MAVAKRIIPCLDVDKGRVVKGVNFLNIRDAGDPVEIERDTIKKVQMRLQCLILRPATKLEKPHIKLLKA